MMSSSTMSGGSAASLASASSPDAAVIGAYPFAVRMSASSLTFCGVSSTTRTFGNLTSSSFERSPDGIEEGLEADRLRHVVVEACFGDLPPVGSHDRCGHRDHRDRGRRGIRAKL